MPDPNEGLPAGGTPEPGASATPQGEPQGGAAPATPAAGDSRFQKRIDQLTARAKAAEERAMAYEQRMASLEQTRGGAAAPTTPNRPAGYVKQELVGELPRDQWEEWHAEDPVAAYQYMADIRADAKAQQIMHQLKTAGEYESTIGEVYKNHPELREVMEGRKSPEEAPFWNVYDEVAREMPDARYLAKGPLLVMREAERRMKERETADREKQIAADAAQQESDRQQRVGASHTLGAHATPPPKGTVKLSPDEERTARKMGISPEEYAKYKG